MICRHYQNGQELDVAGLNVVTVLVDRSETQLTEVRWNRWRKGLGGPPHSHEAKEQILYVTDGEGIVVVGPARYAVKPCSLIYVPPQQAWESHHAGRPRRPARRPRCPFARISTRTPAACLANSALHACISLSRQRPVGGRRTSPPAALDTKQTKLDPHDSHR